MLRFIVTKVTRSKDRTFFNRRISLLHHEDRPPIYLLIHSILLTLCPTFRVFETSEEEVLSIGSVYTSIGTVCLRQTRVIGNQKTCNRIPVVPMIRGAMIEC